MLCDPQCLQKSRASLKQIFECFIALLYIKTQLMRLGMYREHFADVARVEKRGSGGMSASLTCGTRAG